MKIRRSFLLAVVFCLLGASCGVSILQEAGKVTEIDLPEGYDYEKIKAGFLEYLNYEAWFHPAEMPQEEHEITYEILCPPKKEGVKEIADCLWIDCLTEDGSCRRYVCVPQAYQKRGIWYEEYHFSEQKLYQREETSGTPDETGTFVCLGKDTVTVPAVTKPEFLENEEQKKEKEEIFDALKEEIKWLYDELLHSRESLVSRYNGLLAYELQENGSDDALKLEPEELFDRLYEYGYGEDLRLEFDELFASSYDEDLKLELIVSEFSTDKGCMPYSYLIINDEMVFECSFEVGMNAKNRGYANYSDAFQVNYRIVQSLSTPGSSGSVKVFDGNQLKPLDSIDTETAMTLERIKEASVFRYKT